MRIFYVEIFKNVYLSGLDRLRTTRVELLKVSVVRSVVELTIEFAFLCP